MINQLEYIINKMCGIDGNESQLFVNLSNKYHYITEINKYLKIDSSPQKIVQSILELQMNRSTMDSATRIFRNGVLPSNVSVEIEFEETQHEAEEVEFTYENLNQAAVNGNSLEYESKDYAIRDAIESCVDEVSWNISHQDEPEPYYERYNSSGLCSPEDDDFVLAMNEYVLTDRTDDDHYVPSNIDFSELESWVENSMITIDENSPTWEHKLNTMLEDLRLDYKSNS